MARKPAPDTRERILLTAARLFDTYGVHAVGLQQIIDESACGKNLLYREFANKDDLVVAYLRWCRDSWRAAVDQATRPYADDPAAQLVAVIRFVAEQATAPGHRGCPVHNTYAEFPDPDHPAHQVSVEYFDSVRAYLHNLATKAGAADPDTLADRLLLLVDGMNVNGAALGPHGAAPAGVAFAEEVIRAAVPVS